MSYELEVQKSAPSIFNPLSGTTPPLAAGTGTSTFLSTTPTTVTFNAWIQLREKSPFTAELWYLPVNVAAETVVIGHAGEGVLFDGSDLILRVKYSGSTTIEGRWSPTEIQNWHIMLVYTTSHWILYVNGDEVITLDVPNLTLLNTTATVLLNSGPGTGVYDSLALYYKMLSGAEALNHYTLGKVVSSSTNIAASKAGSTWALTYDGVDTLQRIDFDLSDGYTESTTYGNGQLVSLDATGGTWQTSIPLAAMAGTTTAGVHLTYVGDGITLAYSLNGSTWTTTPNKKTILEGATSPDVLFFRLTLADDKAWVTSFRADILNTRTLAPFAGSRNLVFKGAALDQTPGLQLDYQTDQGAQLRTGGYLEIQPDVQTPSTNITAVEAWIRIDGSTGSIFAASSTQFVTVSSGNLTATGVTMYRNGVPLASGQPALPGRWNHYVFVLSTPLNTAIRLGNNLSNTNAADMSVGHVAGYGTTLSAAQIQTIYNFNIGATVMRVDDSGAVGMSESVPGVDIYAYTWSIVSGSR